MGQVVAVTEREIRGSRSIVGFTDSIGPGHVGLVLTLDGVPAFDLGTGCDTCAFLFERLGGANTEVEQHGVSQALTNGVDCLEDEVVDAVSLIIPDGRYKVALERVHPTLVEPGTTTDYFSREQVEIWGVDPFWDMPHNPKIKYYRTETSLVGDSQAFYEFVVPMYPHTWLSAETVGEHRQRIRNGTSGTAISLAILDIRSPVTWVESSREKPEPTQTHWCLAHYLLDGHHKVYAAALEEKSVTLIAFLAIERGRKDEVARLLKHMESGTSS